MWPVLANQLGPSRAERSMKRSDESSAFDARIPSPPPLASSDKIRDFKDALPPPWRRPKLAFKGGWLKRMAAMNNLQKFFLRAQ